MNDRSILLVEDNPQDEWLTLRALRRALHPASPHATGTAPPVAAAPRVDVVRDGQQALDFLFRVGEFAQRDGPDMPTVVLLDIGLPRLTGLEVLQRLRGDERTRLLPVVILTSSDDETDRLASYRSGANSFVRKPSAFGDYADTVARLGEYWLTTNEPLPHQPLQ